jgi:predicted ATPase/DNA-binding SARP family transcriptional activator
MRPAEKESMMAAIKLYLFGSPRLERQGRPIPINLRKALALLIYLAVTRQPYSRDALATLFWPEKDQSSARANLRRTLYDLSQLLEEPLLVITPETVAISPTAPLWLDVGAFQHLLVNYLPTALVTEGVTADVLPKLTEAADYYTNDFLAGFTLPDAPNFDDWQFFQREELRGAFTRLLQQLIATYSAQHQEEEAVRYARRWLLLDPLAEAAHRELMRLYAQTGQQAAALRQYEECLRILRAELDASPAAATTALYEAIRARRFPLSDPVSREKAPSDKGTDAVEAPPRPIIPIIVTPPHNLSAQSTPFVGRQQEVAELIHRLADPACRLLTLVGPGGIGKTRLAVETAQQLLASIVEQQEQPHAQPQERPTPPIKDGLFFVPLQPVNAPSGVIPALAGALGFHFYAGTSPQEQLFSFLREKEMLLVLDNFEHLLTAVDLVAALLATVPGVKLLITSREALKLQEEWFHPLSGLRLPPRGQADPLHREENGSATATTVERYDAVQLFVQTARRALVDFDPTLQQEAIVRICRLVDGMPLAIELAASWLKVLSCTQIADEIARGGKVLVTRHQNVPTRHRNMWVVMAQSWQLLDQPTQQVLRQLAVFQGGFTQDAAAAVAGADLLTLAELVDKAWIYHTGDERYQMHELLRQFAAEQLTEAGAERVATEARHTSFYLQQVAQREEALIGPQQRAALDAINTELDNIQTAWRAAVDHRAVHLLAGALQGLYRFYHIRSRYGEGLAQFAFALHSLTPTDGEVAEGMAQVQQRLRARLGAFDLALGALDAAEDAFTVVQRESAEPRELAFVHAHLGNSLRFRGERQAAQRALQQSLTLARASGDQNRMAKAYLGLADVASSFSHFTEGEHYAREALTLCRQLQRPDLTAQVVASLAWAVNSQGAYAESARYYRESLAIAEAIGNPFSIGLAIQFLGWVAFCEGGAHLAEALTQYERAIAIFRQIGHKTHLVMTLGDYALTAAEGGDQTAAFHAAQEGLALAEAMGDHSMTAYTLNGMGAAACGLQDFTASRRYLYRSLQISSTAQMVDHSMVSLYWLAHLLLTESQETQPVAERQERQRQALALFSLVTHSTTAWQLFRDRAQRAQTALAATLPADLVAAAKEQGQRQPVDEVIATLLDAFANDQWAQQGEA